MNGIKDSVVSKLSPGSEKYKNMGKDVVGGVASGAGNLRKDLEHKYERNTIIENRF